MKNMIIFGDSQNMKELENNSIHLVVIFSINFNALFDYPNLLMVIRILCKQEIPPEETPSGGEMKYE